MHPPETWMKIHIVVYINIISRFYCFPMALDDFNLFVILCLSEPCSWTTFAPRAMTYIYFENKESENGAREKQQNEPPNKIWKAQWGKLENQYEFCFISFDLTIASPFTMPQRDTHTHATHTYANEWCICLMMILSSKCFDSISSIFTWSVARDGAYMWQHIFIYDVRYMYNRWMYICIEYILVKKILSSYYFDMCIFHSQWHFFIRDAFQFRRNLDVQCTVNQ